MCILSRRFRYLLLDYSSRVCRVSINRTSRRNVVAGHYIGILIGHDCIRRSIHSGYNPISILTSITLQGGDLVGLLMRSYHEGIKLASSKWYLEYKRRLYCSQKDLLPIIGPNSNYSIRF